MTTYEQIGLLNELYENKPYYLKLMGDDKELIELYDQLEKARSKHLDNMYMGVASRAAYGASLKEHKVDPFIAGGAAQGVAGLGAGLYAASSSAARNDRIEAAREYNKRQVLESSMASASSGASLSTIMGRIVSKLNRNESIRAYRNDYKELKYKVAKELMNDNITINAARKEFLFLGNYKDSEVLAKQCEEKAKVVKKDNEHKTALITSAVIATLIALFLLFSTWGAKDALFFTGFTFVAAFIMGFIYCEIRIAIKGAVF